MSAIYGMTAADLAAQRGLQNCRFLGVPRTIPCTPSAMGPHEHIGRTTPTVGTTALPLSISACLQDAISTTEPGEPLGRRVDRIVLFISDVLL